MLAAKPDLLSSMPGAHMMEGKGFFLQVPQTDFHICVCTQRTQHTFTHKVFHISHTVTYAARFGAQKLLQDTFRLNPNHRALLVSLRRLVFLGQCVVVSSYWKNVCLLIKDTLICGQGFYSCSIFAQQNLRGA